MDAGEGDLEVEVDAPEREKDVEMDEEEATLRRDARSEVSGGAGAARRTGGGRTVGFDGLAGSFGGTCPRRAIALSQSCEMVAAVPGLASAALAESSSKLSALLPVWVAC